MSPASPRVRPGMWALVRCVPEPSFLLHLAACWAGLASGCREAAKSPCPWLSPRLQTLAQGEIGLLRATCLVVSGSPSQLSAEVTQSGGPWTSRER